MFTRAWAALHNCTSAADFAAHESLARFHADARSAHRRPAARSARTSTSCRRSSAQPSRRRTTARRRASRRRSRRRVATRTSRPQAGAAWACPSGSPTARNASASRSRQTCSRRRSGPFCSAQTQSSVPRRAPARRSRSFCRRCLRWSIPRARAPPPPSPRAPQRARMPPAPADPCGRSCRYPDDLLGPQCVIIVPHRELGVQIALLTYRLFGGSVNPGVPGAAANMFTFTGPRGIKVKGCLDKEEVLRAKNAGALRGAHVVVGTPECLAECLEQPSVVPVMQHSKVRPSGGRLASGAAVRPCLRALQHGAVRVHGTPRSPLARATWALGALCKRAAWHPPHSAAARGPRESAKRFSRLRECRWWWWTRRTSAGTRRRTPSRASSTPRAIKLTHPQWCLRAPRWATTS